MSAADGSQPRPVRVVVGEDSYLTREGVVRALAEPGRVEVVAAEGDYDRVLAAVEQTQPDVVVTDIRMPPTQTDEGIRLARELAERDPAVGVVVLSQHAYLVYATTLFESAATRRAYLVKDRIADRSFLLEAVTSVARGIPMLDPQVVGMLVDPSTRPEAAVERLTDRERDVLACVAAGASNGAIADELHLTTRAVEKHINSIFAKLALPDDLAHNRRVLAAIAYLGYEKVT